MSWEQAEAFLAALVTETPRTRVVLELMLKTGLRPGEGPVLRVEDLDLRARSLRVERAWSRPDRRVKATKTYEHRTVELSTALTRTLQRYLVWLRAEALKRGAGAPEWLFVTATGQPLDEWQLGNAFRRVCRRAGLAGVRPYDLRHTYASGLLSLGAPVTKVSQQLGHANPFTTWRYYARWIPTEVRWVPRAGQRWADALDSPAFWNQKQEPDSEASDQSPEKIGRGDWI
jgi:integrase